MKVIRLDNENDWLRMLASNMTSNCDNIENNDPEEYPCVAVIAYAGEGWDQILFIYQKDIIGCPRKKKQCAICGGQEFDYVRELGGWTLLACIKCGSRRIVDAPEGGSDDN